MRRVEEALGTGHAVNLGDSRRASGEHGREVTAITLRRLFVCDCSIDCSIMYDSTSHLLWTHQSSVGHVDPRPNVTFESTLHTCLLTGYAISGLHIASARIQSFALAAVTQPFLLSCVWCSQHLHLLYNLFLWQVPYLNFFLGQPAARFGFRVRELIPGGLSLCL